MRYVKWISHRNLFYRYEDIKWKDVKEEEQGRERNFQPIVAKIFETLSGERVEKYVRDKLKTIPAMAALSSDGNRDTGIR